MRVAQFAFVTHLKDLLKLNRIGIWLLVAVAIFGIGRLILTLSAGATADETYSTLASLIVYRVQTLIAAILIGTVLSQELDQRTAIYHITRPISRGSLIIVRTLATCVAIALVSYVTVLAAGLSIYGFGLFNVVVMQDLWVVTLGAFAYGSLFACFSVLFKKALLANLLFAFGWEVFVPNIPGDLYIASISTYLKTISAHSISSDATAQILGSQFGIGDISKPVAYIVLIALGVGLTFLAAFLFSDYEYVPTEDSA